MDIPMAENFRISQTRLFIGRKEVDEDKVQQQNETLEAQLSK